MTAGWIVLVVYDSKMMTNLSDGTKQIMSEMIETYTITDKSADKIKKGMTISEIEKIVGCQGRGGYYKRTWFLESGGALVVEFKLIGTYGNHYLVTESITITH